VVEYLIKPATEDHGRCRFADLPSVRRYTKPATVFMSHCWRGRWGDLVAAACAGAQPGRIVWIDIIAVRQWPGNFMDIDFRAVIRRCRALIVAVAPFPGTAVAAGILWNDGFDGKKNEAAQDAYLKSEEYAAVAKVLAFARLWCIGKRQSAFHFCFFSLFLLGRGEGGARAFLSLPLFGFLRIILLVCAQWKSPPRSTPASPWSSPASPWIR